MSDPTSRWNSERTVQRGADYDERWARMAAAGRSVHGEVDFVCRYEPESVLDAGCGTGRVAIELAARGVDAVGVDLDVAMLAEARAKAPSLTWVDGSVETVALGRGFDVVVMAGNVMIFVQPGTETAVVANLAGHLEPEGVLISGFQLGRAYDLERYDADCSAAGLVLVERFATWDGTPFVAGGDYAVSVHRRPG
ncbi:MAG: class I SAM-dependent methyltransferase [Ilumatobacteraceae bacterium]|nr:class I SAM-dependent methyltransferase [Ilumatobacteraceae bacterium]